MPDLSKRLRPVNSLLRKGVTFAFTSAMEKWEWEILAELATPPILVFPNWDPAQYIQAVFIPSPWNHNYPTHHVSRVPRGIVEGGGRFEAIMMF